MSDPNKQLQAVTEEIMRLSDAQKIAIWNNLKTFIGSLRIDQKSTPHEGNRVHGATTADLASN